MVLGCADVRAGRLRRGGTSSRAADWLVGLPLALGSAAGACLASLLAAQRWAGIWVYRILVLVVIGAVVQYVVLDTREFLAPFANCQPRARRGV